MTSMVVGGLIMTGFGVLVLVVLVAYSHNEGWRMTAARNRSVERRLSPAVRAGRITAGEWNKRFADQQRRLTRRVGIPIVIVWIAVGLWILFHGLV